MHMNNNKHYHGVYVSERSEVFRKDLKTLNSKRLSWYYPVKFAAYTSYMLYISGIFFIYNH